MAFRIACIHPATPGALGGGELVMVQLMAQLAQKNHALYAAIAATGQFERALQAYAVQTQTFPLLQASAIARRGVTRKTIFLVRNVLAAPALARWLHQHAIQVAHTATRGGHIAGVLAGRLARVPVIMHMHELAQWAGFYTNLAQWGAYRLIVSSRASQIWYGRHANGQRLLSKTRLIPNPVDTHYFSPQPPDQRLQVTLGLQGCYPVMVMVGALEEQKAQGVVVALVAVWQWFFQKRRKCRPCPNS